MEPEELVGEIATCEAVGSLSFRIQVYAAVQEAGIELEVSHLLSASLLKSRLHTLAAPLRCSGLQIEPGVPTGHRVNFLPPILLKLALPHKYPTACGPAISVSALWLSQSQAKHLLHKLEAQAKEEQCSPVGYTLVSWLEAQALYCVGFESALSASRTQGSRIAHGLLVISARL